MTPEEARAVARETAESTVANVFLHLGYDVQDRDQIAALKRDLAHLRRWREATETVRRQGLGAAATLIAAGTLGAAWLGFQALVRGGGAH